MVRRNSHRLDLRSSPDRLVLLAPHAIQHVEQPAAGRPPLRTIIRIRKYRACPGIRIGIGAGTGVGIGAGSCFLVREHRGHSRRGGLTEVEDRPVFAAQVGSVGKHQLGKAATARVGISVRP